MSITTNTAKYAKRELEILERNYSDSSIKQYAPEILSIAEKFGKSGLSGSSAPYTAFHLAKAIENLCLQKPISPMTGLDDEWIDVSGLGGGGTPKFQNKRCGMLFKDNTSFPWYLEAILWRTKDGVLHSGSAIKKSGEVIDSRLHVKIFPFEPKTFIVDVEQNEVSLHDFTYTILDEVELNKALEYYIEF